MKKNSEMSRIVELRELTSKPKKIEWKATKDECIALAKRLNILSLDDLDASVTVQKNDLIQVSGSFIAHVKQACVVSGEPIAQTVKDSFEEFFCQHSRHEIPIDIDMDAPDVEVVEDGRIDVGELVVEYLILGLDPFPRKADLPFVEAGDLEEKENPFAVLKNWKKN